MFSGVMAGCLEDSCVCERERLSQIEKLLEVGARIIV